MGKAAKARAAPPGRGGKAAVAAAASAAKAAAEAVAKDSDSLPWELFRFSDAEGFLVLADWATKPGGDEDADSARKRTAELAVMLQGLSEQDLDMLWRNALEICSEHLSPDGVEAIIEAGNGSATEAGSDPEAICWQGEGAKLLGAVAFLLAATAEHVLSGMPDGQPIPPAFNEAASLCQDILLSLPDKAAQSHIASALEQVCLGGFQGREDFYGGVLMFLAMQCLEPKATNADVERFYRVRGLLPELDWEHESIVSMKSKLAECVSSPNFVRATHGPDLVALLFTVHPSFTQDVHKAVKSQVLLCRSSGLKAYSVALFKAWKTSEGSPCRVHVEQCVQDWITLALRTSRKHADRARAMLEELHSSKHEDAVGAFLCRVYGPLLWRSLSVANAQVRENATKILQYVLPLLPKDSGVAKEDEELVKQMQCLSNALRDPSESVRRAGVASAAGVLKNYWEFLPAGQISELLSTMVSQCARDKTAPAVRAAVAEGISWILLNPLSHPTVANLLPKLSDLLNDRSPLVRAAFVGLLIYLNNCRGIPVQSVVSHEALLLRLVAEHAEGQAQRLQRGLLAKDKDKKAAYAVTDGKASPELVAKQLTRLIAPCIFREHILEQVNRCEKLLSLQPLALVALLSHLHDVVPAVERGRLSMALFGSSMQHLAGNARPSVADEKDKPKLVSSMIRAAGVLLEGISEPAKARKGKTAGGGRFPPELSNFIYSHLPEEDFLPFLRDPEAAFLRDDLLFTLGTLDPGKLPGTASLIRHELTVACCGGAQELDSSRVLALMRIATRWGILCEALEPIWDGLLAVANRLARRQQASSDAAHLIEVLDLAFRDPDARGVLVRTKAAALERVAEALSEALSTTWSLGLQKLQQEAQPSLGAARRVGKQRDAVSSAEGHSLLGPASDVWPQAAGVAVRIAMHLEFRGGAWAFQQEEDGSAQPIASCGDVASRILQRLLVAVASSETMQAISSFEAAARQLEEGAGGAASSKPPPAKRRKKAPAPSPRPEPAVGAAPSQEPLVDVDAALRVQGRLLEAANAATHLSVLQEDDALASKLDMLVRPLEDAFWRLSVVADKLWPSADQKRTDQAWLLAGRLLLQRACSEGSGASVLFPLRALLRYLGETGLAQEADRKKMLGSIFSRLEYDPQLAELFTEYLRADAEDDAGLGRHPLDESHEDAGSPSVAPHPRAVAIVKDLLSGLPRLLTRPQGATQEADTDVGAGGGGADEKAEEVYGSAGHFSASVPSYSPAQDSPTQARRSRGKSIRSSASMPSTAQDSSLFDKCFAGDALGASCSQRTMLDAPSQDVD